MTIIANEQSSEQTTQIQQFYADQKIFITGGTGFLGKVLIEKLLRSCSRLTTIYLLVRPKKGKDIHNRLEEVFSDPVFDRLKKEQPKYQHKVVIVQGDCSLPNLGLSVEDRELLIRETTVVFNVAATVRFDEKIKDAVAINVSGTREVLNLCRIMPNLKSVMHVSTAYSNCVIQQIDEKIYTPPISGENIEKLTECLNDDKLDEITPTLLEDFPNTYTYTKLIAESVVKSEGKDLPIGIFRPSMVISTSSEPVEGWIDNIFGPSGGIVGAGAGLIRTFNVDHSCSAELVPVDLTVNALIAMAWDVANKKDSDKEPPVYNYVATWKGKGITWEEYNEYALKYGSETPSIRSIWCYVNYTTKYKLLYNILAILLHILPALIIDAGLLITGNSPKILKMYKKIHKFSAATAYFANKSWKFENGNTISLWEKISAEDKETFNFSMENFDWDSYMQKYILGLRLYIFKDDPSTIPAARRRMAIMRIFHNIVIFTFFAFVIWSLYKLTYFAISFGQRSGSDSTISENLITVR